MSRYWAHLNSDNEVLRVIVAEEDYIQSLPDPGAYIETWMEHEIQEKVASIGFIYDAEKGIFNRTQGYKPINCQAPDHD